MLPTLRPTTPRPRFLLLHLLYRIKHNSIHWCRQTFPIRWRSINWGRTRTNVMLLERLAFLISLLSRQIVVLVVCVTIVDYKLIHFLHNSFKHSHIWTIVFVLQRGYSPLSINWERTRTNGMLLERLAFLINLLSRQIVALAVCVTIVDYKLIQFLHNSFKHRHIWAIVFVLQRGYRPLNDQKYADIGT